MRRTARRYWIGGRVQGVGFRAFVKHMAGLSGVTGWARNLADGRVEVHANGTEAQLGDFEAKLRIGPRLSEVREFHFEEAAASGASSFEIR